MMRPTHLFRPLAIAILVTMIAPAFTISHAQESAQDAASSSTASEAQEQSTSKIIEGRVNPYSYNPTNTEGHTDVDLRGIFEGLGPIATEWYQHVLTLSNPFFEGRVPASRGSVIAGEYIEFYFKQSGLEPAFPATAMDPSKDDGSVIVAASVEGAIAPPSPPNHPEWTSWRQQFDLAGAGPKLVSASAAWSPSGAMPTTLTRGEGFSVLGNSASGKVSAPLTFAGYAITEGQEGYTSFADSKEDFTGRIVMFMRYEPLDEDGVSLWSDRRFSPSSAVAPKMEAIMARNPAGIIMVNPPGARDGRKSLESSETSRFGARLDVPVIQLSPEAADEIIRAADPKGRSLMDLRKLCDQGTLLPLNFKDDVSISMETELTEGVIQTHNLGGVLRGKGALADQWVIIGAHYDHVGFGYYGADPSNRGRLHPGADDNASGTSAMLCLVKRLSEYYRSDEAPAEMRSVLFMGFSAEEVGLDGSAYWTKNPTLKNEQVQAMINLDMVGRMRNDELAIGGTATAKDFMNDLRPIFDASGLTIRADPSGRGPSDHASFYRAGIPVLFLFTGSHDDYHKPSDHGYTVNPQGAARVVALTESLLKMMAMRADKLEFTSTDGLATSGRQSGSKVRFGVMPGYGESDIEGVKVDGVSAETSAADAGILAGDLLIGWGDSALTGPADLMARLREQKPGDVVKVKLKRGNEELTVDVTLRAPKSE
ncbi:MAG: M28 family peptidase [Phycisphaerales bacterium]|nr:M28 family peptidase [Phycisphaerales bacterium]